MLCQFILLSIVLNYIIESLLSINFRMFKHSKVVYFRTVAFVLLILVIFVKFELVLRRYSSRVSITVVLSVAMLFLRDFQLVFL